MTIEIHGSPHAQPQVTGNANTPARKEPNVADAQSGRGGVAHDSVSLTDTAQQLRSLEHNLAQHPVVDTQRVEAVKQAIDNGSYQVDPQRIASKMIDLERALSGSR